MVAAMSHPEDRLARLLETGMALASELSLPSLLQRIVELAVDITGARYGALGVVGGDGDLVDFLTTGITDAERAAIGPLPKGRGLLGALVQDARPLRLEDLSRDPRSAGFPPNHPPMRTFLGVPVRARGQVFGNLYLTEQQGGPDFTAEDRHLERAPLRGGAGAGALARGGGRGDRCDPRGIRDRHRAPPGGTLGARAGGCRPRDGGHPRGGRRADAHHRGGRAPRRRGRGDAGPDGGFAVR
ncbi:MAG: GAF domain-containing protein [Chloroflexi bacterium]|nr:MAG: GAF domain-containing protein [Chloroflexota bacterium]